MENEHGPCALADDEVALPMTSLGSGVDIFGPFMDGDAILYRISRRPRSAQAAAFVTSREITPQLLGLLGGAVDEGVDRLAAHGPQTAFVSGFQPARDLLGRPPFGEAVENEAPQGSVFLDQRFTPPAQLISSGGVKRRERPLGSLLRDSSREIVDFGRRIALAMAPIEWPRTFNKPICSLSSSDKCE